MEGIVTNNLMPNGRVGSSASSASSLLDVSNYDAGYYQPGNAIERLGSWLSGSSEAWQNYLNQKQSLLDKQYEIDFDSTRYQRTVQDLKAAGLNPWLAIQNGVSGGSSGSSASNYSSHDRKKDNVGKDILSSAAKIGLLIKVLASLS